MILLGKTITVTGGKNSELVGLTGIVTEDNMHTLRIMTPIGEKLLVKSTIIISIDGQDLDPKEFKGTHASRAKK